MREADLSEIRRICSRFPEAEESEIQDRPLFHVRRRRFAIYNPVDAPFRKRWKDSGRSIHFATSEYLRTSLEDDNRFTPSPHHGFRGWMALSLNEDVDWKEIDGLLLAAYRHVANKQLIRQLEGGC